jgi:hypothetical protein
MSRSLYLLSISGLLANGCSDDSCGPGGAPAVGIIASGENTTLTFGNLTGGLNNDCPAADAPSGVISLSIHGTQSDGTGLFTLCIARPDLIGKMDQALGPDVASSAVHVVDVSGTFNNCSYTLDKTRLPTGKASTSGLCGDGSDSHGFALVVDGAVPLTRNCSGTMNSVSVTVTGRVKVTPQ